jgi:hypothetical protein
LDIKPYKFNLPNKIKNERKDLLKSASIIQDEFGKGVENLDICIHYSMKNNKSKLVEESLDMFTSFLQQATSPENPIREILLCSGGGKDKAKIDSLQILKSLPPSLIPENISLAVVFNPYDINTENEQGRLKEKLFYSVDRIYLQFGSDVDKLIEGMDFIVELNKERVLNGKVPLKITGSVMIPSKQLLARFRFRPWAGLVLSEDFLNDIDFADKTVRNLIKIYNKYNVEPIIETTINSKNFAYFKDLFSEFDDIQSLILTKKNDPKELNNEDLSPSKKLKRNI